MSPNKKLIFADALLIGSCAYAIISGSLSGKKFAIVGVAIFLGSGILNIANEVTSNNNISKCDEHVYYVAEISCIDLIVTDICIMSSVDTKLAALFLVPPIIDLVMKW